MRELRKSLLVALPTAAAPPHPPAVQVSHTRELGKSLLVTGFGYEHDECWAANIELFKHFTDVTQGVRRLGSAAVDMCHVASGALP